MKHLAKYVLFLLGLVISPALFASEEFDDYCSYCGSYSCNGDCITVPGSGTDDDPHILPPFEETEDEPCPDCGVPWPCICDDEPNPEPDLCPDCWSDPCECSPDECPDCGSDPCICNYGNDGGGGNGNEGTDNGDDDCGVNPFNLKGNVIREVTDLSMTGRESLHWIRYNNSIPRMFVPVFGQGASWRHNWQYELRVLRNERDEYLLFIYPSGVRRSFRRQADGSFATLNERYTEKARIVGERVEITTRKGAVVVFEPVSAPAWQAATGIYKPVALTGKSGRVTRFDFDDNGLLQTVTNEAGTRITLYYQNIGMPCISRVETSDGRAVEYDYETMGAPGSKRKYATLVRAHYGDGTNAEYKYDFVSPARPPLLVEADDPRYKGRAKHIGYRYHSTLRHGVIHQEFNPLTGSAYATLEFDSADPERRIVHYTDGRSITYRVPKSTNGRATERVDSLGRKRTWSYGNEGAGWLEEKNEIGGINVKYTRNKKGRPTRVERSDGLAVDIERDKSGKVARTRDNRGRTVEYLRDSKGRVIQSNKTTTATNKTSRAQKGGKHQHNVNMPASKSRNESIKRDAVGRPMRRDYSDGTYEEFKRDKKGNVVTQRDRKGRFFHYTHAERGLIASETNPAGQVTRYTYDTYGQRTSQTDALGRVTTWERNERGLVTKQINPDGTRRVYSYDKYGLKVGEVDEIGRTAAWKYDSLGRLTSQTDFAGGSTQFDYTETPGGCGTCSLISNPTRIIQPDGRIDEFLYDTEGRMLMRSIAVGTGHMSVTLYAHDDADNIIQQTNPDGGVIKHTYDINNRRLSTTDALGRKTHWTYDDEGNVLSYTDASGRTTDYAYDTENNLIYTVTADDAETTHEYDASNRRINTTDAMGNTTRWNYDDAGNLTSVIDAAGGETRHEYDSAGRRVKTIFPDGTSQTWIYNDGGQVVETTTVDGLKVEYTYDKMGRMIIITKTPAGASSSITVRSTYDDAGRLASVTDALNRTTRYEYNTRNQVIATIYPDATKTQKKYDGLGRVIVDIDQLDHTTKYTYTALGDMATLTDAKGNTYAFEYDAMRRKTAMIYPDDSEEKWAYDRGGRSVTYTTRAGQTKAIAYNADNRLLSETWKPAGCAPDVTYAYDKNGRLASADNGNALLTYTYDKMGRTTSETTDIRALLPTMAPHTVGYLYDARGRKAGLEYPDGMKVTYHYDVRGRMIGVHNGNTMPLAIYEYDAHGRRSKLIRDNGVTTNYTYDNASQVLAIDHLDRGNNTLASAHYEYDNMGRRTSMTREGDQIDRYHYDATSQLTGVDYGHVGAPQATLGSGGMGDPPMGSSSMGFQPMSSEYFTYDPLGNRITHTATTPSGVPEITQYQPNNLNQYTRVDETAFSHDPNGSLLNDGAQRYGYDAQSRLVAVESESARAEFAYDASNRCILRRYCSRSADGEWMPNKKDSVVLTYDTAWNLLVDHNLAGQQTAKYVYGNRVDEILANIQTAGTYYPHGDALGNTLALSGANGQKESEVNYTAYGLLVNAPAHHRFLYTGREWLAPAQLNDHRYRYYHSSLGRWLTCDPIRFEGKDENIYRYVNNSPTCFTDSTGLILNEPSDSKYTQARDSNLNHDPGVQDDLDVLRNSTDTYNIVIDTASSSYFNYGTRTIHWNPDEMIIASSGAGISPATVLGHEMSHASGYAADPVTFNNRLNNKVLGYDNEEEERVITKRERNLAKARKEAVRYDHKGRPAPAKNVLDKNTCKP